MKRSQDPNPSPTTFVQADAHTFRDLVQKLTGASENSPDKLPITLPVRNSVAPRKSSFKLQERRQNMRKLEIKLGLTSLRQTTQTQSHLVWSPIASPVTPLGCDSHFLSSGSLSPAAVEEEEKAIAEKGFYLHPSPLSTPRGGGVGLSEPPELLPLFPLQSPKQQHRDL